MDKDNEIDREFDKKLLDEIKKIISREDTDAEEDMNEIKKLFHDSFLNFSD